jgi:hypothetical protein
VAADLWRRLELAVDAAIALLDPPRVPWQVEVEEVRAMGLEIQALTGGIRGNQDPQRILRWIGVEPPLDVLATGATREPVDHLDALLRAVRLGNGLLEKILEVALRSLAALREDQDAAIVPLRR